MRYSGGSLRVNVIKRWNLFSKSVLSKYENVPEEKHNTM